MSTFEPPPFAPPPPSPPPQQELGPLHLRAMACCGAVLVEYAPLVLAAVHDDRPTHHDPQGMMGDVLGVALLLGAMALVPLCALTAIVTAGVSYRDRRATRALRIVYATAGVLAALPLVGGGLFALVFAALDRFSP